jgi:hypothetical protein
MTVAEKILASQACAKCKTYPAIPPVDKNQPAVKHVWYRGDTRYFTVSYPLAERTGKELCYYCEKFKH